MLRMSLISSAPVLLVSYNPNPSEQQSEPLFFLTQHHLLQWNSKLDKFLGKISLSRVTIAR